VFSAWPGIEVASTGLDPKSKEPVTPAAPVFRAAAYDCARPLLREIGDPQD
jgi:hypothetical protein